MPGQAPQTSPGLAFALYSAANTSSNSGGNFDAFVYMRNNPGQGPGSGWQTEPSQFVSGSGNNTKITFAPGANNKQFVFAFLDTSGRAGTLTKLKINLTGGPWLFQDGSASNQLLFSGSQAGVAVANPSNPSQQAQLYSAITTRLIPNLQANPGDPMKFNVQAVVTVGTQTFTYGQDPEIGVDNGGDS